MITIWKFQLPIMERATVTMPEGADVLRVDGLDGKLWLWAVVDTEAVLVDREFLLFKTGASMDGSGDLQYLGCGAIFIQMELMLYVFEEITEDLET